MTEELPQAGCYPGPAGSRGRRFWDGSGWTEATAPDEADGSSCSGARGYDDIRADSELAANGWRVGLYLGDR